MLMIYLNLIDSREEHDKFEQLYLHYRDLMIFVSKNILQDDFLAEDAVHNAFLRVIKSLDKIDDIPSNKAKSFMVTVVENTSKDLYKSRKKNQGISFDDIEHEIVSNCNPVEDVIQKMSVDSVVRKIDLLSHPYKEVLMLKFYHELSDKEIAKVLEISPGNARKRIERGRLKIDELCRGDYL